MCVCMCVCVWFVFGWTVGVVGTMKLTCSNSGNSSNKASANERNGRMTPAMMASLAEESKTRTQMPATFFCSLKNWKLLTCKCNCSLHTTECSAAHRRFVDVSFDEWLKVCTHGRWSTSNKRTMMCWCANASLITFPFQPLLPDVTRIFFFYHHIKKSDNMWNSHKIFIICGICISNSAKKIKK